MKLVTEHEWKQAMEGLARGRFEAEWVNVQDGDDACRTYCVGGVVRMCMRVCGANTDQLGYDCERVYEADQSILDLVADIKIPTEADWEEFDEFDGDDEAWLRERGFIE